MDIQDKEMGEWDVWAVHVLKSLERLEKDQKEFIKNHDEVHERLIEKIEHIKECFSEESKARIEREATQKLEEARIIAAQKLEDAKLSAKDKIEQAKLNTETKVKLGFLVGGVSVIITGLVNLLIKWFSSN